MEAQCTPGAWALGPMQLYVFAEDGSPVADREIGTGKLRLRGHGAESAGKRPAGSQFANGESLCYFRNNAKAVMAEVQGLIDRVNELEKENADMLDQILFLQMDDGES